MSHDDVKGRIVEIMIHELQLTLSPDEIHSTNKLDDLFGMDSIAITELIIGIEQQFNITIPAEDLSAEVFKDLDTLTEYVKRRLLNETAARRAGRDKTSC